MKTKKVLLCSISLVATLAVTGFVAAQSEADYIAHEWGTFTSVQGGDGALRSWRPLETSDLPPFVYNWARPGLNRLGGNPFSKGMMSTLQRMETPVIYFYSPRDLTVDVSVRFPGGLITEWFPHAGRIGPAYSQVGTNFEFEDLPHTAKDSRIEWHNVRILPATAHPEIGRLIPPQTAQASHYFAARETESAFVQVNTPSAAGPEYDRFLFYRGAGSFSTPLVVTMDDQNRISLSNSGPARLSHFFVLTVNEGRAKFDRLDHLAARTAASVNTADATLRPINEVQAQLAEDITTALTTEGLYPREATAMVNTWKDSWFTEEGVRVLYVLPREWTDATLPLTLSPQPKEIVRVMVGRAEVIPPSTVKKLTDVLARAAQGDTEAREQTLLSLQKLGRFADAGLVLATQNADIKTVRLGWELLHSLSQPVTRTASIR